VAELRSEIANRLAKLGQRLTDGRRQIVDALARADRPLTIPELLESGNGLAQSSAYRNLSILETAGVVVRVVTTDEFARFELAEDLTGHHHHVMCVECGAVRDIVVPEEVEHDLDRTLERVALAQGYSLQHHRLDLIGVCAQCR
jgi:Fe2+ or Zn2+ uptake regulation protein